MSKLKKIGIIGYGKMGKEIFISLHDHMTETKFAVISMHDNEEHYQDIIKTLNKSLKRKRISEEIYNIRKNNFTFSNDKNMLYDCDLIIESVTENLELKKSLFSELDKSVVKNCIFATNSSSIPLRDIFSEVSPERKTMGFHFFYPVKLSGYIELNDCDDDSIAKIVATALNKELISFSGNYCFYLNQFISFCMAHGLILKNHYGLSILQCMDILSEIFPMHSLFGMTDAIGLDLLVSGDVKNFCERIRTILEYSQKVFLSYMEKGCSGYRGKFLEFISEFEKNIESSDISYEKFKDETMAAIINEAINAAENCGDSVICAVEDILGFAEPIRVYYQRYGYQKIRNILEHLYNLTGYSVYTPADESIYNKYFLKECD